MKPVLPEPNYDGQCGVICAARFEHQAERDMTTC